MKIDMREMAFGMREIEFDMRFGVIGMREIEFDLRYRPIWVARSRWSTPYARHKPILVVRGGWRELCLGFASPLSNGLSFCHFVTLLQTRFTSACV
jgi:hypothetical protein